MCSAKCTKSDDSTWKTAGSRCLCCSSGPSLKPHKKGKVPHAHGKVRKVCLALGKDGKALVSGSIRGCGVTHHGFCVWDCSLFCVSDLLHSHWSPPGTFFRPLLSARYPCCTTVIPLRICSLRERKFAHMQKYKLSSPGT